MHSATQDVLVVGDNSAVANLVRFNLQRAGLQVTTASNGEEALELLECNEFGVIITDYQMPGVNGAELCLLLRQQARWSKIPVLLVTAKALELDLPRLCEQFGVCEVFSKPFSPRALTRAVQRCLGMAEQLDPASNPAERGTEAASI